MVRTLHILWYSARFAALSHFNSLSTLSHRLPELVGSSLQNVADSDEISLGLTSRIGVGLRNVLAEAGKSGAEVEKLGHKSEAWGSSPGRWGGAALCPQTQNNKKYHYYVKSDEENNIEIDEKMMTKNRRRRKQRKNDDVESDEK